MEEKHEQKNIEFHLPLFIVGLVFFISGMMISGPLGTLIAIIGGFIVGLSLSLDNFKKLYK